MMSNKLKNIIYTIACGVIAGTLFAAQYVVAPFISEKIYIGALGYGLLMALVYSWVLVSDTYKRHLLKFVVSSVVGVGELLLWKRSQFSPWIRIANYFTPGYGNLSAGAKLAYGFLIVVGWLLMAVGLFFISIQGSASQSFADIPLNPTHKKLQLIIGGIVCLIVAVLEIIIAVVIPKEIIVLMG